MMYLDLEQLEEVFRGYWFWSAKRPAPAWFRRRDHWGDPHQPLATAIRNLVAAHTGERPAGPVCLLTHLRYFGYCFNPVSFYYCHDENGQLQDIVLEVNNTPWGERHCYVLPRRGGASSGGTLEFEFAKAMHVSPFLPMDMRYRCRIRQPGEQLLVGIENWRAGQKVFDAHLSLRREPITHKAMARQLALDPVITLRIIALIMWQAGKLWWKQAPVYTHPARADKLPSTTP